MGLWELYCSATTSPRSELRTNLPEHHQWLRDWNGLMYRLYLGRLHSGRDWYEWHHHSQCIDTGGSPAWIGWGAAIPVDKLELFMQFIPTLSLSLVVLSIGGVGWWKWRNRRQDSES